LGKGSRRNPLTINNMTMGEYSPEKAGRRGFNSLPGHHLYYLLNVTVSNPRVTSTISLRLVITPASV
jgi:hypothetical protein